MATGKWNPLQELQLMQEQMNRLFDLSRQRSLGEPVESGSWHPAVDIYEDEAEVVVKMEVPEVDQRDIDVTLEEGTLVISGCRELERKEKQQNYHRIERSYGSFRRSFSLPATIDQERISARCDRGVLKVVLPKKSSDHPRQIEVEVK
ncbi:Hsp20/alpha crystallin family protein [Desulfuromonas sp. AOP6]|uniref:Hsp20/alpha crystallin family protein n=1 Tax=Desulfuromonas sp. AOP6 TaxID=1566351 RepID=UPI001282BC58|nr:Hsp20/alpha crystallin family protein [Desulfuromonas sp. AOP6]BCA78710.1 molecular chaperone [Desulfuromonas sp. AOP6]